MSEGGIVIGTESLRRPVLDNLDATSWKRARRFRYVFRPDDVTDLRTIGQALHKLRRHGAVAVADDGNKDQTIAPKNGSKAASKTARPAVALLGGAAERSALGNAKNANGHDETGARRGAARMDMQDAEQGSQSVLSDQRIT